MIISRYLFREITYTLLALALLLILVYISHRFLRYLIQASMGDLPSEFILQLLALHLLSDLMLILPLGFFLAILLTLGRLYKDNEITALIACGAPLPVHSIFILGVIFASLIGLLSLFLAPWAQSRMELLKTQINTAAEMGGIAAGRFQEFSRGNGAFYVENIDSNTKEMQIIFIQFSSPRKQIVVTAERGYRTIEADKLYMTLIDGHRYESEPGQANYVITDFVEHTIKIPDLPTTNHGENREAISTRLLWTKQEPVYQAELQWRLSLPLSTILLTALAIPLSRTTPRQGQYAKIFAGVLIYLIYNNLLSISQKWVEQSEIAPWLGVWWVHGVLFVIILLIHLQPFRNWRFWSNSN
ncbi:MAG: LPS export ABC transporter permease LptF [Beggiatoa sp. IS2]|nr:MAG: LPS export ABC transporter permease LptF [Beggiatoa sp. IS2]